MHFRRRSRAALVAGLAVTLLAVASPPANAIHQDCDNEPLLAGGDDVNLDIGPGILFVGLDKGDHSFGVPTTTGGAFVCVASDILGLDIAVEVDRGDVVPRVEFGSGCALDLPGGGCELGSFQVVLGDADAYTVAVFRDGLPAGDGTTFVPLPGGRLCIVAVGQACV